MVEILMTPLDVDVREVNEAAALLSDDERQRASRYAGASSRDRYMVARARLRRELGARLMLSPQSVDFAYGPQGKPHLPRGRGYPDLHFSVSHCAGFAALAFATGREVGVDIETLRAIPEAESIVTRWCTQAEWQVYESLAEHEKLRGFLGWWTRKEAMVKAQGGGLSQPIEALGWTLSDFNPGPGLVGAVAFATSAATGVETLVVRD